MPCNYTYIITFTQVKYTCIMKQLKHSCIKSLIGNHCLNVYKYMQNVRKQTMDFNSDWLSQIFFIKTRGGNTLLYNKFSGDHYVGNSYYTTSVKCLSHT